MNMYVRLLLVQIGSGRVCGYLISHLSIRAEDGAPVTTQTEGVRAPSDVLVYPRAKGARHCFL